MSRPATGLIPKPVSVQALDGAPFELTERSAIGVSGGRQATQVGESLARLLRPSTGFALPAGRAGDIWLEQTGSLTEFGAEGYQLEAGSDGVTIRALTAEGLFRGVTTLRQLLPARIEQATTQLGSWTVDAIRIADRPRFGYRGTMLDVARHFFTVDQVKR